MLVTSVVATSRQVIVRVCSRLDLSVHLSRASAVSERIVRAIKVVSLNLATTGSTVLDIEHSMQRWFNPQVPHHVSN